MGGDPAVPPRRPNRFGGIGIAAEIADLHLRDAIGGHRAFRSLEIGFRRGRGVRHHAFLHELKVPIATVGMGYPDTRAHAPDENIRIDLYLKHAKHVVRLLAGFGSGAGDTAV